MNEAERITRSLHGQWYGSYGLACCPAHNNTRTPALSLTCQGARLLMYCHAGCSFPSVLDALRGLGLVKRIESQPHARVTDPAGLRDKEDAAAFKRERQAIRLWREAHSIKETSAETYLRGRGITCLLPTTLRFHPEVWHGPSAKCLPAMIALVEGSKRFALHRTYFRPDGSGKASIAPSKMMLGATAGGAVRLVAGDGPLVVAEGIETALSLASGLLQKSKSVWAALSASGMKRLKLLQRPGELIIATDGDPAGAAAGNELAHTAFAAGWDVSLMPAPERLDWNDVLQKGDFV